MPTNTTNIGLQVPDFNQANWQVPTDFNWQLLDAIFGGSITVPSLNVTNLIVANIAASIVNALVNEQPSGAIPGSVYTLSQTLGCLLGFYVNGLLQRPGIDYTVSGQNVNLTYTTQSVDTVFASYLKIL